MNAPDNQSRNPNARYHGTVWLQYLCGHCNETHTRMIAPLDDILDIGRISLELGAVLKDQEVLTPSGLLIITYGDDKTVMAYEFNVEQATIRVRQTGFEGQELYRLLNSLKRGDMLEPLRKLATKTLIDTHIPSTASDMPLCMANAIPPHNAEITARPSAPTTPVTAPAANGAMSKTEFERLFGGSL